MKTDRLPDPLSGTRSPQPALACWLLPTACLVYILIIAILFLSGCTAQKPQKTLTQISTINALLAGCYDGVAPIKQLHQYGDFGIGAYKNLNGEMVMLNDTLFQILVDGTAKIIQLPDSTPFAAVVRFQSDTTFSVTRRTSLDSLRQIVLRNLPSPNLFYAIKMTGRFESTKTRSVPPQVKPYQLLIDVVAKQQKIRDSENIAGTLVGFYLPEYVKGINVPGFHLHFISADRKIGGHLLECVMTQGSVEWQAFRRLNLILPEANSGFDAADFIKDRSSDLGKVIMLKKN